MILRIHFWGGPLDGGIVEGDGSNSSDRWQDFAAIIKRDTDGCRIGAIFETINPYLLLEGSPQLFLQLHRYQIEINLTAAGDDPGEIQASYAGPSNRAIEVSEQARKQWMRR